MAPYIEYFDAQDDVVTLREALQNLNKDMLINILCDRNLEQRQKIVENYNAPDKPPIEEQLTLQLKGHFQKLMLALINMKPIKFYADELHTAFEELQSKTNISEIFVESRYNIIANILCTRTNREIGEIKSLYENTYGHTLEADIKLMLRGQCKIFLVKICNSTRDEGDVAEIPSVPIFKEIYASESFGYRQLLNEQIADKPRIIYLLPGMAKFSLGYKVTIDYSNDKYAHYAKMLHDGLKSKNNTLISLMILQCHDLPKLKLSFEEKFRMSLRDFIKDKSSSDYKHALYKLFGETRRVSTTRKIFGKLRSEPQ